MHAYEIRAIASGNLVASTIEQRPLTEPLSDEALIST